MGTAVREVPTRAAFDIVAIGSSAGGVQALQVLVAALPLDFPMPILICQHVYREKPSLLPQVLAFHTKLSVEAARPGARPEPGTIHVAPSNRHLLVRADGTLGLSEDERVNYCRPSVDVLFHSVAAVHGHRALGIVLTGYGRDGAMGCRAIQARGGLVLAQDEASSDVFDMPRAARDVGGADLVMPLSQIPAALGLLAAGEEGLSHG